MASVSERLVAWFAGHGRRDLPWQRDPTPYRIWVSEIMLQQTQVKTVAGYFERFVGRYPRLGALAAADLDQVLHLWSGLGYYARARNLHRAARIVEREHGGVLPADIDGLAALPGIGRSTAGAILALSSGARHAILDGNARRVLCRLHAVEGWPGTAEVQRRLWALAERHTPAERVAEYTQAIMDLGATVCTRRRPRCGACPLAADCRARRHGLQARLPAPRARRPLPVRRAVFVILRDAEGRVLLEKRPPSGVWGGLWSLPQCPAGTDVTRWCAREPGCAPLRVTALPVVRHTFSHFRLEIEPVLVEVAAPAPAVMEAGRAVWYKTTAPERLGLAAPVSALLSRLDALPAGES